METRGKVMIEIEELSKRFDEKIVLNKINCKLEAGLSYTIVGKSGVGKTTLLNIMAGLELPTSGKVMIDHEVVNQMTLSKLRREKFGFIFQNFGLIDEETVADNLQIAFANQKIAKKQQTLEMRAILDELDLKNLPLDQKIYALSGGEQQRVALARIILKKPTIVFADEPTGSLDAENSKLIIDHLLTDFGPKATILIATHDPQVWNRCDRVISIENQQIVITKNNGEKL